MSNLLQEYGAATALTITLNALAASATAGRASVEVDNTSTKYLDALVQVKVTVGTVSGNKVVNVYAYGTVDETNIGYTGHNGGITGVDAAYTLVEPTMLRLIGTLPCPTSSVAHVSMPMSVAAAFGGVLPEKWGLFLINDTGAALAGSGNAVYYRGIYASST